jgi:hypothetical protein
METLLLCMFCPIFSTYNRFLSPKWSFVRLITRISITPLPCQHKIQCHLLCVGMLLTSHGQNKKLQRAIQVANGHMHY